MVSTVEWQAFVEDSEGNVVALVEFRGRDRQHEDSG